MSDLEQILGQLSAVTLELRERWGSAELAWDLCNNFAARLTAGIEVAASRVDYYVGRVHSHQVSVQAGDTLVQVLVVDAALRTDLEDCCSGALVDAARLSAARASVRALLASEAQHRAVSMRALPAALFHRPAEAAVQQRVRCLLRRDAVWVAPPCAQNAAALYGKRVSEKNGADGRKVRHGPPPDRGDPDLEDGYTSDSALERSRGVSSPYLLAGASSGGSAHCAEEEEEEEEGAAGQSTAAEPASSPLEDDRGAGRGPDQSGLVTTPCCKPIDPSTSPEALLTELWKMYARVCDALQQHAVRLAVATCRSERRARQLGCGYLQAAEAARLLSADVRGAARGAREELARFRQQLRACAAAAADYDRVMENVARDGWWRRGKETAAAAAAAEAAAAKQRPLGQRLADWWRRPEPGDSPADVLVSRLMPPV